MKWLPIIENPFDLSKHLIDEHEMTPFVIDQMDSDLLRRTHKAIHARSMWNRGHIHLSDEELALVER